MSNEEKTPHRLPNRDPVKLRYVIHSEKKGVFLGEGVWSKDETAKTKTCAPTYADSVDLSTFRQETPDAELCQVFPDLAGEHASKAAVVGAALPIW